VTGAVAHGGANLLPALLATGRPVRAADSRPRVVSTGWGRASHVGNLDELVWLSDVQRQLKLPSVGDRGRWAGRRENLARENSGTTQTGCRRHLGGHSYRRCFGDSTVARSFRTTPAAKAREVTHSLQIGAGPVDAEPTALLCDQGRLAYRNRTTSGKDAEWQKR
jgi:hypothetical protein